MLSGRKLMDKKMFSIFAIVLLIVFGIGYSIGSFTKDDGNPSVKAVSDVTFGNAPLEVSFSYLSAGMNEEVKNCVWDFNDGKKASVPYITHTFNRQGTFNVTLTVWTTQGQTYHDYLEISVQEFHKPIASASASKTYGKAPLSIQFTEESVDMDGSILEYHWDFDDETTSNEKNPQHTFDKQGNYTVRLTVTDDEGQQDTDKINIYTTGNYPPVASASADNLEGKAPLEVTFEGNCHDPDSNNLTYNWYFENAILKKNRESTEKNTNHTFYFPGTYFVTLTVEDEEGESDTDTLKIVVKKSPFSRAADYFFNVSKNMFIKGVFGEFIGSFIGEMLSTFFGKIAGNLLTYLV